MFPDGIKIFCIVNNQVDANLLQSDLDTLYDWCINNNFTLNISKCQIMTFSRARVLSTFDYNLNSVMLHHTMGPNKDLGIYFDPKLKFEMTF